MIWYIRGVTPTVARRVCNFAFPNHFIKLEDKIELQEYHVFLRDISLDGEPVDEDMIDWFKEYWGSQYKIFINSSR